MIYYFAYGMLTDPRGMDHNEFVGRGLLNDHTFEFCQFANVREEPGKQVYGTVWMIDQDELDYLDRVEGYPTLYTRVKVTVHLDNGETVEAEMYTMTDSTRDQIGLYPPSRTYLQTLHAGYLYAKIPLRQLTNALDEVTI